MVIYVEWFVYFVQWWLLCQFFCPVYTMRILKFLDGICIIFYFSLYFEKDAFFCDPTELLTQEHGGVAVAKGRKVRFSINSLAPWEIWMKF